jgi:NAD(P)-dependent dehydrogenase (short-subunit alcohol dehydrogenase family)
VSPAPTSHPPRASRVAFVTGAGRGIGAAIARRLAADGCRVAVCDVDGDAARRTAASIGDEGRSLGVAADVTSAAAVDEAVRETARRLGPPDILVNNAGVISAAPFTELEEAEWDRVLDVNLKGQYLCARAVLPGMRERGWGRVVNIASDAAKTAEPFIAHYSASKFGVIGLTQSLALEYARECITVNALCPAIAETDMMEQLADALTDVAPPPSGGWREAFVGEIPLGRAIRPEDVAAVCAFLVTDAAEAISGQSINISGAHEMH